MNLKEVILQIVNDNSGGIKFLDLLAEILARINNVDQMTIDGNGKVGVGVTYVTIIGLDTTDLRNIPDQILKAINECEELNILTYVYKPLNREKYFIYTK